MSCERINNVIDLIAVAATAQPIRMIKLCDQFSLGNKSYCGDKGIAGKVLIFTIVQMPNGDTSDAAGAVDFGYCGI